MIYVRGGEHAFSVLVRALDVVQLRALEALGLELVELITEVVDIDLIRQANVCRPVGQAVPDLHVRELCVDHTSHGEGVEVVVEHSADQWAVENLIDQVAKGC